MKQKRQCFRRCSYTDGFVWVAGSVVLVLLLLKGAPSSGIVYALQLQRPVPLESSAVARSCGGGFGKQWRVSFCSSFLGCQFTFSVNWQQSQARQCHWALDHVHVSPRKFA